MVYEFLNMQKMSLIFSFVIRDQGSQVLHSETGQKKSKTGQFEAKIRAKTGHFFKNRAKTGHLKISFY
jgi:hypothetical protein